MAKNVFISFRYTDGHCYKEELSKMFDKFQDTVDYSEDEDRSHMSESTIRTYLYRKLRRSSVTIILLTPMAVNHKKNWSGQYDDWMYDEIRYSLEDREYNRANGLIAVYVPEAASMLVHNQSNGIMAVNDVDNLFRKNMMNIKSSYKRNPTYGVYDADYDSYCSLISYKTFIQNMYKFIDIASQKRKEIYKYDIVKRMNTF